jgi:hypothetical protein
MTSSTAAPDLGEICRAALGRGLVASAAIGAGRNSRVFRIDLDGDDSPSSVVVKFYRRDAGDTRDRLGTEFESLRFLWENGVRVIPRPIAIDRDRHFAMYEYIAGDVPVSANVGERDIDASVDFLAALERLRSVQASQRLPAASEACFSLAEIVASIERRRERLRSAPTDSDDVECMREWLAETFDPLMGEVQAWCRAAADRDGIRFDEPVASSARTLSPSDFGFHNTIRRSDGTLVFLDFEYFGWDDPAKTIVDYLLHPGMALEPSLKRRFAGRILDAFAGVPLIAPRARIVYPLFGLKWAMILLNGFLPERAGQAIGEQRPAQLQKAQTFTGHLAREYTRNPYLS